jgi:hypothetical protein
LAKSLVHAAHMVCGCVPVTVLDLSESKFLKEVKKEGNLYTMNLPFIERIKTA